MANDCLLLRWRTVDRLIRIRAKGSSVFPDSCHAVEGIDEVFSQQAKLHATLWLCEPWESVQGSEGLRREKGHWGI